MSQLHQFSQLIQWWSDRPPRERRLIIGLAAVIAAMTLYQFGLRPMIDYRRAASDAYTTAAEILNDVEAGAREIRAARGLSAKKANTPGRIAASAAALELGLPIMRLQPVENGLLDVWLEDVSSPLLFTWIARLHERERLAVVRAVIQRNDGGATVRAQITLSESSGS